MLIFTLVYLCNFLIGFSFVNFKNKIELPLKTRVNLLDLKVEFLEHEKNEQLWINIHCPIDLEDIIQYTETKNNFCKEKNFSKTVEEFEVWQSSLIFYF